MLKTNALCSKLNVMTTSKQILGQHGETLVAEFLSAQGRVIVARNWRCPRGELDLITHDGEEWVFVEVRTRRAPNTDSAIESVTSKKQARLIAAAEAYLNKHGLEEVPWRIDLAAVALTPQGPVIEIIEYAVGW